MGALSAVAILDRGVASDGCRAKRGCHRVQDDPGKAGAKRVAVAMCQGSGVTWNARPTHTQVAPVTLRTSARTNVHRDVAGQDAPGRSKQPSVAVVVLADRSRVRGQP